MPPSQLPSVSPGLMCCNLADGLSLGTVLLAYDTLLTLSIELEYIWGKKFKLGTLLYLLARYTTILYLVLLPVVIVLDVPSLRVCFLPQLWFKQLMLMIFDRCSKFEPILQRPDLMCHVRTCNALSHFEDSLSLLPFIGVQGNAISCGRQEFH
jgi:Family of unknown function (DUF6533)